MDSCESNSGGRALVEFGSALSETASRNHICSKSWDDRAIILLRCMLVRSLQLAQDDEFAFGNPGAFRKRLPADSPPNVRPKCSGPNPLEDRGEQVPPTSI